MSFVILAVVLGAIVYFIFYLVARSRDNSSHILKYVLDDNIKLRQMEVDQRVQIRLLKQSHDVLLEYARDRRQARIQTYRHDNTQESIQKLNEFADTLAEDEAKLAGRHPIRAG